MKDLIDLIEVNTVDSELVIEALNSYLKNRTEDGPWMHFCEMVELEATENERQIINAAAAL
jgi:hypothetical protein